ncbi:MAG: serine/threonine protein kinase [Planctomycetaceae bacterium]|nr:serine/threonine protein kinase [Planctomycetaceae bacterium]
MTAPANTDQLIDQLRASWQSSASLSAAVLLADHPAIAADPALAMDVIYAEILLREESGELPTEDEYTHQFPDLCEPIARQFQLHRALREMDDADDDRFDHDPRIDAVFDSTLIPDRRDTHPVTEESDTRTPTIPGFEIKNIAGRGGSGVVYLAFDEKLKRNVAIKLLHATDEAQQQLTREAEASAALDHPHIARIHQIGEHNGRPFLVLEYIDGGALTDVLQRGPLEFRAACELLIDVADAIESAHEQGVIHRDLKPGNVMLATDGRPRVCDFGLARKLDSQFTLHATGSVVGTPAYMSPEQARGDSVARAADLYALGATLYHTLTGRPPFQASTPWEILNQVMTDDPVAVRDLNASIPKDLATICHRAMHKNPERRFPDAAEFAAELRRFLNGDPIHSRPASGLEKSWSWCRRHPALSSVVTAIAVALIAIAGISISSQRRVTTALKNTQTALGQAETQRDVAFDAMSRLVHEVTANLQKHEASVEAREEVLHSAIIGLEKIIETNGDHHDARLTLVEARCMYAYIISQLGRNQEATDQFLASIDLMKDDPTRRGRTELAFATSLLAQHYLRLAEPKSLETAEAAIDIAARLVEEDPAEARPRQILAAAHENRGSSLASIGRRDEGLAAMRESQKINTQLLEEQPDQERAASQLIDTHLAIALLEYDMGHLSAGETATDAAIRLINQTGIHLESDTQMQRKYLKACRLMGVGRYGRADYDGAIEVLQETFAQTSRLIEVEPTRPGFRLRLAVCGADLARCYMATDQMERAAAITEQEITALWKGMELGGPEYEVQRSAIMQAQLRMAEIQLRRRNLEEAIRATQKSAEAVKPLEEKFGLQMMLSMIGYQVEILKGINEQPSEATQEHVAASRRAYAAWRKLKDGDRSLFDDTRTQLQEDMTAAKHPLLTSSLHHMYSLCQAQLYELLAVDEATANADLDRQAQAVIAAVRANLAVPGTDPSYFLGLPEFRTVRTTEAFRNEFALP